jgi:hypothetical protein
VPDDGVEVVQNVTGRNAQDAHVAAFEESIARGVTLWTTAAIMRFAIDFDDQSSRRTIEIGDEPTERMLLSEFEALRSTA